LPTRKKIAQKKGKRKNPNNPKCPIKTSIKERGIPLLILDPNPRM